MKKRFRTLASPLVICLAFFAVAFSPVELLGCRNRGLAALGITVLSGIAGIGYALIAVQKNRTGNAEALWWAAGALILSIPVAGLIILA